MTMFALDYDDTYTRDPALWSAWVTAAQSAGHEVVVVTMRGPNALEEVRQALPGLDVVGTDGQDKAQASAAAGYWPDVWIDDAPHLIGRFF